MKVLQEGMPKSPLVKQWQFFLIGQGIAVEGGADGVFGGKTREATEQFQRDSNVPVTGKVDNATLAAAMVRGFVAVEDPDDESESGPNFPPRPDFNPLPSNSARRALFGSFDFVHKPVPDNPEQIQILGDWVQRNVITVVVPQLRGIAVPTGNGTTPASGRVQFHQSSANQLLALWADWERAQLVDRVTTWGGAFMPRFIRGKIAEQALSVHAFACAFDINMSDNKLGAEPARLGTPGSVRELVTIANEHGFFWGGHFKDRRDGMHFEIARLQ